MRFLFSGLGRYLMLRTLGGVALVAAGVAATVLLLDLVEQLRSIGTRVALGPLDALHLTVLRMPQLIEATLPFVTLAGVQLALFQLNRRSELVAIRASGVSAWRFLGPTALVAASVGLAGAFALNPIGAALYDRYEAVRDALTSAPDRGPEAIWLRQGGEGEQIVITAAGADPQRSALTDAVFMFFDVTPDGALSFARRVAAAQAELRGGFWQLSNVVEAAPGQPPARVDHLSFETTLEPDAIMGRFASPSSLSVFALPGFIAEARAAGLTPTTYELRLQQLIATPALLVAMAALGAVFSLRLHRLGGVAAWTGGGLAAGTLLYFATDFAAAFATADVIPPALAAWAPPVSGFFAALALLSYMEDG